MGSSYILAPFASDKATITASGSAAGAGPENVQKLRPSLYWRSDATSAQLVLDMGAPVPVDALGLGWINGQSGNTFRLRGADSEANLSAAPTYDSNLAHPAGIPIWPAGADLSDYALHHRHFELPQPYTLRWWDLTFAWSGNTFGYVRLGRLLLGKRLEFDKPVSFPVGLTIGEPVAESVDFGGEESPRPRGAKRNAAINLSWATESEMRSAHRLMLRAGSSRDLMIVLQKDNALSHTELTYVGRVKEPQVTTIPQLNRWAIVATIYEPGPLEMVV